MKKILTILIALVLSLPVFASCGQVSLTLDETSIELVMYEEYELQFKVKGAKKDDVLWESSDSKTVLVQNGKITTLRVGNAKVTGTLGENKVTCDVLVRRNKVGRALTLSESELTLEIRESKTVTATFKESGEEKQTAIVWESSLPNVVSVDADGKITALARGNAIVSAYTRYKGQRFVKEVAVRSTFTKSAAEELRFEEQNHGASSLTELGAEKTEYGFADGDKAYKYQTEGGFASRIFVAGAYENGNQPLYDRLIFKLKFTEAPASGTSLWLANYKKSVKGMSNLVTQDNCFLFYDGEGKIAKSFDAAVLYTVVVNLKKAGNGVEKDGQKVYEYGFAFNAPATAYVGGAVLCSEDYFIDAYGFEPAQELPELNYIFAETGGGLDVGVAELDEFDKYWVTYSSGTSGAWDNAIWADRVAIGGVTFSNYRKYSYMRMDIMFTDVGFREIMIWTGGVAIKYSPQGIASSTEGEVGEDDIKVYSGEEDVTGTPLKVNKVYTFRIRIQRDNLENVAFGLSVNSATADPVYLANPAFTDY